jgi:glycosyltransferase involved in cell wall biosynthesis
MRIAIFSDTFFPQINGVTNTFRHLEQYLICNDVDHLFFVPEYDEDARYTPDGRIVRFKGITPYIYPECRIVFPPYEKVLETLSAFQPDVVHIATELGVGLCGLRAARACKLPIVMSYHTNFDRYLEFYHLKTFCKALWAYMKWFHSFAGVNLCPSYDTLCDLQQRGFQKLDIWSRGIDPEQFNPRYYSEKLREDLEAGEKTVFLYVGRIAREKDLDTLAESIRIVGRRRPGKALFIFKGDGPFLEELRSMDLPDTVFTGTKRGRELSEIYASSDVFVFPSGSETFGNVLLEAMASGLASICVDSGGVTDFAFTAKRAGLPVWKQREPGRRD